ncbi:hypothetical protein MRX96_030359 [Rhipicephalus microplus]
MEGSCFCGERRTDRRRKPSVTGRPARRAAPNRRVYPRSVSVCGVACGWLDLAPRCRRRAARTRPRPEGRHAGPLHHRLLRVSGSRPSGGPGGTTLLRAARQRSRSAPTRGAVRRARATAPLFPG